MLNQYFDQQDDIWMWDQDWKCAGLRIKKGKAKLIPERDQPVNPKGGKSKADDRQSELERLEEKFAPVVEMANLLYKKQPKVPGYPGVVAKHEYIFHCSKVKVIFARHCLC